MGTRPETVQKAKGRESKEKAFRTKAKAKAQAKGSKEAAGIAGSMDTPKVIVPMEEAKAKEEDGRAKDNGKTKVREKAGATAPLGTSGHRVGSKSGNSQAQSM